MTRRRLSARGSADAIRSLRAMPDFWRLLNVRMASHFGDGLFQAGMAGALLFNPERASDPMAIARAFAVLFLPYSLLSPFAGALIDRWDRRLVLVWAATGRVVLIVLIGVILAVHAGDIPLLCSALVANGLARFLISGLSASLPHVVPREKVVTLNSLAVAAGSVSAFVGANFMLLPRWLAGGGADRAAAAVIFTAALPTAVALVLATRFGPRVLGPDESREAVHGSVFYTVVTGWVYGLRTVARRPMVAATLSGLAAHRMVVGINSLLVLLLLHNLHSMPIGGMGVILLFFAATGLGSFVGTAVTPLSIRRWGRYATANGALLACALINASTFELWLPVLIVAGFFLGISGQMIKLCADTAMQVDVEDALRGHVFAVQDSLFWVSYCAAITVAAVFIPADGHAPVFIWCGSAIYLCGLAANSAFGKRAQR